MNLLNMTNRTQNLEFYKTVKKRKFLSRVSFEPQFSNLLIYYGSWEQMQ